MAVRHRISFRGDQRPWSVDATRPAPLDVVDLDPGLRSEPPRPHGLARDRRHGSGVWSRGAVLLALVALAALGVVAVLGGQDPPPDTADAVPSPAPAPDFAVPRPAGPVWIPAAQVVAPPLRASLNRYWPTSIDEQTQRVRIWFLAGDGSSAEATGHRALLVADPTRRAQVGSGATMAGDLAVRRLVDRVAGVTTWEWDRPGWGFSLITVGLADAEALAVVERGVALPLGPSLQPVEAPAIDTRLLDTIGLEVRWARFVPSAVVGGPFVGQGGIDTVEGYIYAPGPDAAAGPVLVSGSRDRAVRAADVAAVVGESGQIEIAGRPVVALVYELEAPVGFRITGATRLLFDHDEDITFEVASDTLDAGELAAFIAAVDFDRLARFLRTG